ncbi:MAG TPA: hypothetical protein VK620_37225 [Bradyrhizobium sp.]|nr:hypothetical protein [Bradyrhizobium sp.]
MAVTHATAVRNTLAGAIATAVDAGGSPGTLVCQTSAPATVATLTFSRPSFGAASGGVITAAAIASDTNAVGGTMAQAQFKDSSAALVLTCSVTATGGGGDITFNSVVVSAGQTVAITSLTYTAPP